MGFSKNSQIDQLDWYMRVFNHFIAYYGIELFACLFNLHKRAEFVVASCYDYYIVQNRWMDSRIKNVLWKEAYLDDESVWQRESTFGLGIYSDLAWQCASGVKKIR